MAFLLTGCIQRYCVLHYFIAATKE